MVSELNYAVTYQVSDIECACLTFSAHQMALANVLKTELHFGVLIIAENISMMDRILFRLPQYLSDIRRRKVIVMITNTDDLKLDSQIDNILKKFWKRLHFVNVILMTPCSSGPKVWFTIKTYFIK